MISIGLPAALPPKSSTAMRVASIEPSPEGVDKTPVSSVNTPNLTTPPEISACATATSGHAAATLPRRVMNSRRLIASKKARKTFKSIFSTLDSRPCTRFSAKRHCARENNSDFGVLTSQRIDLYRSRMLFYDDVVGDRQAKASTLASRFCCEEGVEHLFPYFGRNAEAIVANPDLNLVAKVLCRRRKGRLIAIALVLLFALARGIKAVRYQVQESPSDLLRVHIDLTGRRIKRPLHIDLEVLSLGAGTMIGEIEALLDERIGIDRPVLARSFARVQQHILDNGVCALAVLNDLVEVVAQSVRQFGDCSTRLSADLYALQLLP